MFLLGFRSRPSGAARGCLDGSRAASTPAAQRGLLGVELDDHLLAYRRVDVFAQRQIADSDLMALLGDVEPGCSRTVEHVHVPADHHALTRFGTQRHDVAFAHAIAGDVDPLAVDLDVAVADDLARLRASSRPGGAVDDVVEAQLEVLQHVETGDAFAPAGLEVDVAELALAQTVGEAGLLLFGELHGVLGTRAAPARTPVLAGWEGPLLHRLVLALGAPDVGTQAARDARPWSGVASHVRPSAAWAHGNRCAVAGSRL